MYSGSRLGGSIGFLCRNRATRTKVPRNGVILRSLITNDKTRLDKCSAQKVDDAYCQIRPNWPNPVDPTKKLT